VPHADDRAPIQARLVLILGSLAAFGPLSMDMYLPALPTLARDLAASATGAQLTLAACLVGLAGGQVVAGPLSDAFGRRRPLLVGLAAFATASALCALTPNAWALVTLRLVQGAAGAAGIVIAYAIARDLYSELALAKFLALLMIVTSLAPILAPIAGGQLLHVINWRGVFLALSAVGVFLFAAAAAGLPETLPHERRRGGGLPATARVFRRLLADREFVGYAASCGLAFAAMFAYIAGSPFVLQDVYGVSLQTFSLLFALNAAGLVAARLASSRLVDRFGPAPLLTTGLTATTVGGSGLLVAVLTGIGLAGVLPCLFIVVASIGLVLPNATALALADHPHAAGSASALVGLAQFIVGTLAAPLVGVAGGGTAIPMAVIIAVLGVAAVAAYRLLVGHHPASARS
jgi:DHA1 family bicyclomycin/chloramphenicol resistance-like MFS transporter